MLKTFFAYSEKRMRFMTTHADAKRPFVLIRMNALALYT